MIESNWLPVLKHPTVAKSAPSFECAWAARFSAAEAAVWGDGGGARAYRAGRFQIISATIN